MFSEDEWSDEYKARQQLLLVVHKHKNWTAVALRDPHIKLLF